jgi:hypothetical protein
MYAQQLESRENAKATVAKNSSFVHNLPLVSQSRRVCANAKGVCKREGCVKVNNTRKASFFWKRPLREKQGQEIRHHGGNEGLCAHSDNKHFRSCATKDIGGGSLADGSDLLCGWDIVSLDRTVLLLRKHCTNMLTECGDWLGSVVGGRATRMRRAVMAIQQHQSHL